jgi:hypothetical protein
METLAREIIDLGPLPCAKRLRLNCWDDAEDENDGGAVPGHANFSAGPCQLIDRDEFHASKFSNVSLFKPGSYSLFQVGRLDFIPLTY